MEILYLEKFKPYFQNIYHSTYIYVTEFNNATIGVLQNLCHGVIYTYKFIFAFIILVQTFRYIYTLLLLQVFFPYIFKLR